jgi:histone acetyltransferase 1
VKWEQDLRKKYKIAQRQFDRLLEMLLLKQLDKKDAAKVRAYRLHVKSRLFRFNYVSCHTSCLAKLTIRKCCAK